jgi:hypothetical protein
MEVPLKLRLKLHACPPASSLLACQRLACGTARPLAGLASRHPANQPPASPRASQPCMQPAARLSQVAWHAAAVLSVILLACQLAWQRIGRTPSRSLARQAAIAIALLACPPGTCLAVPARLPPRFPSCRLPAPRAACLPARLLLACPPVRPLACPLDDACLALGSRGVSEYMAVGADAVPDSVWEEYRSCCTVTSLPGSHQCPLGACLAQLQCPPACPLASIKLAMLARRLRLKMPARLRAGTGGMPAKGLACPSGTCPLA